MIGILLWIIFGGIVGFLAEKIMKTDFSLLWNVILGIIGSFVGGLVASLFGIATFAGKFSFDSNFLITLIFCIAGSCLVIYIVRLFRKFSEK